VEAGSNTSTVTQRVVGGDEKGSLGSETVKYGRLGPENDCAGEDQQQFYTTDPFSRQRERLTSTNATVGLGVCYSVLEELSEE
jgi:hypothetical protein